jgi:monoamine oxidase
MSTTVIVGAGIAGLCLARTLARRGDRVVVLEKYDYLGGRVLTSKKHHVEIGAGRVHESHRRVGALVDEYGLTRISLSAEIGWIQRSGEGVIEPNNFESTWSAVCDQIAKLSPAMLASHTLRELATKTMGARAADTMLIRFPYRAEVDVMRADVALRTFRSGGDMTGSYYVVREGLSTLIKGLARDCRRAGVEIRLGAEVVGVEPGLVRLKGRSVICGDRIVLATHVVALRKLLPSVPAWTHLSMEPLTRIYAQYPTPAWFEGMPKVATDSPLRYIIPVNPAAGVIMISYTDADDTRWWRGLKGKALVRAIQSELRVLFPDREIPEPHWLTPYEWSEGCTYWLPGDYDPVAVAAQASSPMEGVYVCGESLSVGHQAWMEGALETAEVLAARLT